MSEESSRTCLLLCLRENAPAPALGVLRTLSRQQWDDVAALSRRHGLAPILYQRLKMLSAAVRIPAETMESLRLAYVYSSARNIRLYRDLGLVLSALRGADVPAIALKGAYLADAVYRDAALRPMSDIDLLVRVQDIAKASEALVSLGYRAAGKPSPHAIHLDPFTRPGHVDIEIHYHIVDPAQMKEVDVDGLWRRAQDVRVGDCNMRTLSREDLFLQLCLHMAVYHGFNATLCQLYDIRQSAEFFAESLDWRALSGRARAWGAGRAVQLVFLLTEKLFGLNAPKDFMQGLSTERPDLETVALAQELLFSPRAPIPESLARILGGRTWRQRARNLLAWTFPAGEEAARRGSAHGNILKIYLYYPLRITQLVKRYFAAIWRILVRDEKTVSALKTESRRNKLTAWILSSNARQ